MDKFSIADLAGFTDKASRETKFRDLYEQNDYIAAYAAHTDMRVDIDPHGAIGGADEWDSHGLLQRDFLIKQGMKPHHTMLDIGCGVGRGSRRFVPYLNTGNYTGIDISLKALDYAIALSVSEGWAQSAPRFLINSDLDLIGSFDYLWAHSVATHLPEEQLDKMIGNAANIMGEQSKFLFTYKRSDKPKRTGLKQFSYSASWFTDVAESHGLKFTALDTMWPAKQRTGLITRAV